MEDHSVADCLWVTVLSHGDLGIVYAKNSPYKPDRLWSHFSGDKCKSLAGKPKIFTIQACQGDQLDTGIEIKSNAQADGLLISTKHQSITYKIPSLADFLIIYSSMPGFYSWRNTTAGTWFIQALVKELSTNAHDKDLLSILTRVAKEVAYGFTSNTPGDPMTHGCKQIPCITSMLTRDIFFNKK